MEKERKMQLSLPILSIIDPALDDPSHFLADFSPHRPKINVLLKIIEHTDTFTVDRHRPHSGAYLKLSWKECH
jgi:hypothetical protein